MVNILVTGGLGFIGSHIVDALLADGACVRILDNLHPGAHAGMPSADPAAEVIIGDLRDPETVLSALRGIDVVCHQAAMVGLGVNFADVRDYVSHNDQGTATLLWGMDAAGFHGRMVLASSMVVYGEGGWRCTRDGQVAPPPRSTKMLASGRFDPLCPACGNDLEPEAVPESAPADPRNVYAATKLHQEHLCAALARERNIPLTVLRYHNVYGPGMPRDTPYAGVASIFRSALERGEAPQVFEDGRQVRDFVHVRDVARANAVAIAASRPAVGAFNVASGEPHTIGEMAHALWSATGGVAPAPVVCGRFRAGDVRHVFASPERAARVLGFRARVRFADGMREFAGAALREPAGR